MAPMLDVSDEVRAEIGDEETQRLLTGESSPGTYDCTSCRTPGDSGQERTSTVLFVGDETAVLAFAHATCIPSQVVPVSEAQLQGAVRSISGGGQEQQADTEAPGGLIGAQRAAAPDAPAPGTGAEPAAGRARHHLRPDHRGRPAAPGPGGRADRPGGPGGRRPAAATTSCRC